MNWLTTGCLFAFLSVATGAFGAHGLEGKLEPRMLTVWETAARYQMYHALALVGLGLFCFQKAPSIASTSAGWAFTAGIFLFSGSLYALSLSGIKILGAITPIGGLGFMIGWICFSIAAFKS